MNGLAAIELVANAAQEIAEASAPVDWDKLARDYARSVRKFVEMERSVLEAVLWKDEGANFV